MKTPKQDELDKIFFRFVGDRPDIKTAFKQAIATHIKQEVIEAVKHVKEICPVTDGASAERLHSRIDTYIDTLTKSIGES